MDKGVQGIVKEFKGAIKTLELHNETKFNDDEKSLPCATCIMSRFVPLLFFPATVLSR